eukprot:PhF_6_TR18620/c0_g1_i2/m.27217/K10747/LIG1; DNA ligase 1
MSIPLPMLATLWTQRREAVLPSTDMLYGSPKLDGIRCVGGTRGLFTRNLVQYKSCQHIHNEITKVLGATRTLKSSRYVLDGELYVPGVALDSFDFVASALKMAEGKATPAELDVQRKAKFFAFDIIDLQRPKELTFVERYTLLKRAVAEANQRFGVKCVSVVPHEKLTSELAIEKALDTYVDKGYEGMVLRTPGGKYEVGKRSQDVMKYVPVLETEFDIFDVHESNADKGALEALVCVAENGKRFLASVKVDDVTKRKWWSRRHELIGKKATVKFPRVSAHGVPRFPVVKSVR